MLRARPERCPLCGHDVRGVVRCRGCGERLLVASEPASAPTPVRRVLGGTGSVLVGAGFGVGIAFAALVHPLLAVGLGMAVPVTAGAVGVVARQLRLRRRQPFRMRERRAPPVDGSMALARQTLVDDPTASITVRGRVQVEIPAIEGTELAVSGGAVGRVVLYTRDGEALIDDDAVEVASSDRASDGDLLEVTGRSRLVVIDGVASDYRGSRARIVFEGTSTEPLRIRVI